MIDGCRTQADHARSFSERARSGSAERLPSDHRHRDHGDPGVLSTFLRFWSFEAEGEWAVGSLLAALLMLVSSIIQIVALGPSLRMADNDSRVYAVTLKVFMLGVALALASVMVAAVVYS